MAVCRKVFSSLSVFLELSDFKTSPAPFLLPKLLHCFRALIKTGVKLHLENFPSLLPVLCGGYWPKSGGSQSYHMISQAYLAASSD